MGPPAFRENPLNSPSIPNNPPPRPPTEKATGGVPWPHSPDVARLLFLNFPQNLVGDGGFVYGQVGVNASWPAAPNPAGPTGRPRPRRCRPHSGPGASPEKLDASGRSARPE